MYLKKMKMTEEVEEDNNEFKFGALTGGGVEVGEGRMGAGRSDCVPRVGSATPPHVDNCG